MACDEGLVKAIIQATYDLGFCTVLHVGNLLEESFTAAWQKFVGGGKLNPDIPLNHSDV